MNEKLLQTLQQLHDQLGAVDELDATERSQLENAIKEIRESLGRHEVRSSDLAKRFHETTEKFSDAHPQLTQTAGQFADILSQMGI